MAEINIELVRYDTEKTKKRKRSNLLVNNKSEQAVIEKLEKIHKGDKVVEIFEIIWGDETKAKPPSGKKLKGWVKFFDETRGFGFVEPDTDMDDLFFHESALGGKAITDGDFVEFQLSESPKGQVAIALKLIEES